MDGETDWKLRVAVSHTQALTSDEEVMKIKSQVYAEKPHNDIHSFIGTFTAVRSVNDSCAHLSVCL